MSNPQVRDYFKEPMSAEELSQWQDKNLPGHRDDLALMIQYHKLSGVLTMLQKYCEEQGTGTFRLWARRLANLADDVSHYEKEIQ